LFTLLMLAIDNMETQPNVGSSKNLGRTTFRKMPEAGLKIAQKGLKTRFLSKFCRGT